MLIKNPIYLSERVLTRGIGNVYPRGERRREEKKKKHVETLQHIRFPELDRATAEEKSSNKYTKLQ